MLPPTPQRLCRRETVMQKGSRRKAKQSSSRKDSAQTGKQAGETEISAICSTLLMLQCSRPTLAKAKTRTLKVPRPRGIALRVWRSKGITLKVLRPMGIALRVLRSKGIAFRVLRSRGIAPRVLRSKGIASRVLRSKGIALWVLRSKGIASKVLRSQGITPRVPRPKGITPHTHNRVVSRVRTSSTSIRTVLCLQGSTNRTNKAEVDGGDEAGLGGEEVVGEPFVVPFEGPFEGHSEEVGEEGVELPSSPRIERETHDRIHMRPFYSLFHPYSPSPLYSQKLSVLYPMLSALLPNSSFMSFCARSFYMNALHPEENVSNDAVAALASSRQALSSSSSSSSPPTSSLLKTARLSSSSHPHLRISSTDWKGINHADLWHECVMRLMRAETEKEKEKIVKSFMNETWLRLPVPTAEANLLLSCWHAIGIEPNELSSTEKELLTRGAKFLVDAPMPLHKLQSELESSLNELARTAEWKNFFEK
uniref:Uncharacterized protein n=1 Tax=Chromera velia CCMP2878 TaxID=1169474 RepID=A0A0G4IBQ0_9ALVE|eukprot:Cvel_12836.t1-p1 / transcript=Cvel_12836.t1 / gene=Cvel_12836 / organism=Chromera_velia_CCMP2878 / gene_product=Translation initiation factor IF-2, putative / transcript_product=Translation initiation factor IF-2, putative / location=Cvel_scaffold856:32023-33456(+) / protein_length=478 / sequence_SO=supercontig / SO=protein_coding / is_pseudo=false